MSFWRSNLGEGQGAFQRFNRIDTNAEVGGLVTIRMEVAETARHSPRTTVLQSRAIVFRGHSTIARHAFHSWQNGTILFVGCLRERFDLWILANSY